MYEVQVKIGLLDIFMQFSENKNSLRCGSYVLCWLVSQHKFLSAIINMYLRRKKINANKLCKFAKNAFCEYVFFDLEYTCVAFSFNETGSTGCPKCKTTRNLKVNILLVWQGNSIAVPSDKTGLLSLKQIDGLTQFLHIRCC